MIANPLPGGDGRTLSFGLKRRVAALGVVAVLLVGSGGGYMLASSLRQELEAASNETRRLSLAVQQHAARAFETVDLSLRFAGREFQDVMAARRPDPESIYRSLNPLIQSGAPVRGLFVVDATGAPLGRTGSTEMLPLSAADREYFAVHRERRDVGLHIGAPLISRAAGTPAIFVSRRLEAQDGRFLGVVAAFVEPLYFERFFSGLAQRPGDGFELARRDGTQLVGHRAETTGLPSGSSRVGNAIGAYVRNWATTEAVLHLGEYPLQVRVSFDLGAVIGPWLRRSIDEIAVGAAALAAIGVLTAVLLLQIRRRERAERDLADREARWYQAVGSVADVAWEVGPDLKFRYVEGRRRGKIFEQAVGQEYQMLDPHGLNHEALAAFRAAIDAGRPVRDVTLRGMGRDGRPRYYTASGRPIFDAGGKFVAFSGVSREITAELEAEHRARQMESRLVDAVKAISEGFVLWDASDRLVIANERFIDMLDPSIRQLAVPGVSYEDLTRAMMRSPRAPQVDDIEAFVAERVRSRQNPGRPRKIHLGDGSVLLIGDHRTADGGVVGLYADITESEAQLEAVRRSEARARSLIENNVLGILVVVGAKPVFCNTAYARMLGYDTAEEVLKLDSFLLTLAPEAREESLARARRRAAGEATPESFDTVGMDRHGRRFTINVQLRSFEWDGQPAVLVSVADVSEVRRAAQEIAESRRLLQDVIDELPAAVTVKDRDLRYVLANRQMARNRGVERDDLIGRRLSDFATAELASLIEGRDRMVLETGQALPPYDFTSVTPFGKRDWLGWKRPLLDAEGRVTGVLSVQLDVTDRKAQERELIESRRLQAAVMDAMPGVVNVKDREGRYIMVNRGQLEVLGLTSAEVLGRLPHEVRDLGSAEIIMAQDRRVLDGGVTLVNVEQALSTPIGGKGVWLINKRPVRDNDGRVTAVVTVSVDISELKRAEAALQISEQRFRGFAESASDWFFEMDKDLRFSFMSERVREITGDGPEFHIGKTRRELALSAGGDPDVLPREITEAERTRKPYRNVVLRRRRANGELRWFRTGAIPVFDESGTFTGYRGAANDITDFKRAEAALAASNAILRSVIDLFPGMVSLKDRDRRFVLVNRGVALVHGIDADAFLGKTREEVTPDLAAPTVAAEDLEVLTS
ncbi:MAG: PAS domain S-box protein, partial [Alphaproteobacteria bacterium]|nr:PAS domain S-box protein [Alphaproteobacteria bacterium]